MFFPFFGNIRICKNACLRGGCADALQKKAKKVSKKPWDLKKWGLDLHPG